MFAQTGLAGDFLKLKEPRALFRQEQHFPSSVVDRGLPNINGPTAGILERAKQRVEELLSTYERHTLAPELEEEMIAFAEREAQKCGFESLTAILDPDCGRQVGVTK